ncbi:MAG: MmgE/PrpD family protein [Clostridiaceae bacterium]|jgi:2-methylcitrate dehydratase PrpD|nr:MmgE/PrpD family protein [Clostridiaceae bacterium]
MKVTEPILDFVEKYRNYENIPEKIIHEIKRALLDGLGNALGGLASDKGKIGAEMARMLGGPQDATVIGVGGKVSAAAAAFANAELLNGLDMDPIPHVPPVVLPAILAVAEAEGISGREFLSALAVGLEIAQRLNSQFGMVMITSYAKYGKTPDVFSNGNENIIGAAIGCAVAMGLDREKIAQALGIAAYYCTLPVCRDWESTNPKSMIKYCPVSWLSQGSVQAAMLAKCGYTSNRNTLDSEYGFPLFNCRIDGIWNPERLLSGLGENWGIMDYKYKPYPCCSFIHSVLDCFYRLQDKEELSPKEIEAIDCYTGPFNAHPDQYSVANQVDVQFSAPYCMALAAYGYKPGPSWQSKDALTDPKVRAFMHKVTMNVAPEWAEKRKTDFAAWYGRIEVKARGKVFIEETLYPRGNNRIESTRFSDEEMVQRFRNCAYEILVDEKIDRAVDAIMNLEKLNTLDDLMDNLSL